MASPDTEELRARISSDNDFRTHGDAAEDAPTRGPPRKRRRIVISCTECHRRKQKCDRKLPCRNCTSRNKQDVCKYDTGAPTMKDQQGSRSSDGDTASPDRTQVDSLPTKVANFGYSQTGASTLGFLRKIEGANPSEPLSKLAQDTGQHGDHLNMRERYKSLIRQLPARMYIDRLVDLYFLHVNWNYYSLDRDVFNRQLAEWHNLPFSVLTNGGPQALPANLRAFPALLFQVLATALLVLPSGPDSTFDSLKYAGNMTFEDLAVDYSESGVAILSLLGKRQMSVTTVFAGFLRAAFLKYVALVTEAWHAIGTAIRDAQEIGLHRDSLDPKPASDDAEAVLENQWEIQRRRKLWMTLVGWDIHTGVVLGRPTSIDISSTPPTLPVDAPIPKDRSKTPVLPRGEDDPPTPLTRALWAFQIMIELREVLELEKEGPCPKDFSRVDRVHQRLLEIEAQTPPYFRVENPDKRFDSLPDCYWIPFVRATLPQLLYFNLMALHRPYIFTRPKSRTEALKASLAMLDAQQIHFQSLKPEQYKTFSLFFGTFDAIVLMASIYILFPKEHRELVQSATQHFHWAVERFEAMSERNALARAALGVLQAIYIRLRRSFNMAQKAGKGPAPAPAPSTSTSTSTTTTTTMAVDTPGTGAPDNPSPHLSDAPTSGSVRSGSAAVFTPAGSDMYSASSTSAPPSVDASHHHHPHHHYPAHHPHQQQQQQQQHDNQQQPGGFDWSVPSDFDWSTIQPIFATGDLVYNDLVGVRDSSAAPSWAADTPSLRDEITPHLWQFDGDFSNDSVWNLLNQYNPL